MSFAAAERTWDAGLRSRRLRGRRIAVAWLCLVALHGAAGADFRETIERDWIFQEQWRRDLTVTPEGDAAGGCDGVVDGGFGFHTNAAEDPWWQVDLGSIRPLARVVVWNRCDTADRANGLALLLSDDGASWRQVYQHDGTTFYGFTDGKPLVIALPAGPRGRYLRVVMRGSSYCHLDEVEVFGPESDRNLALNAPATQVSISPWSVGEADLQDVAITKERVAQIVAYARSLARECPDDPAAASRLAQLDGVEQSLTGDPPDADVRAGYFAARWVQRELLLTRPELGFASLLATKRVPGRFNHMSDQYYGWWSRPGGGIYRIDGFRDGEPMAACLTDAFAAPGSFLRPDLSYDGRRILFAWCRYYPDLADQPDKVNKANVPEDAFYHIFEMDVDGTNVRQLTFGKYDDFDARYLPDGRIVFLSTRRGQALQVGRESALATLSRPDLPDSYVRCGGDHARPVAVYTLHRMDADGGGLFALSPFEMFEWTPTIAHDGTILYSRWDYVDRWNMPFMSLWKMRPDGTNAHLVYGNFTHAPHCTFEPQPVPGSHKILFTASGHHAQTIGSLVMLDPRVGTEGPDPLTRLTPEVCFPEIEGWPHTYYATPWPLSERFHLVAWGRQEGVTQGGLRPVNGMGLYLLDVQGGLELLYSDSEISAESPIPLRTRPRPPILPDTAPVGETEEGAFFVADVYEGLTQTPRGSVKELRVVAVPVKTQPEMNTPSIGVVSDDPGKCVLGSAPVAEDGSAFFKVPAGVSVFFQLVDAEGKAVQTMRSATHVQPGQTLGCVGCHEPRQMAGPLSRPQASRSQPARLTMPPSGAWPYRFDRLVQPVLDRECVSCHSPGGPDARAAALDLTGERAYDSLTNYGSPSLHAQVTERYMQGASTDGDGTAAKSALLAAIRDRGKHPDLEVSRDGLARICLWMDTYAQRAGSFSEEQERNLEDLRERWAYMLEPRTED